MKDAYIIKAKTGDELFPINKIYVKRPGSGDIASLPGVRKDIPLSKEQLAKNKKEVEERKKAENAKIIADRKARIKASEEAKKKPFSAKRLAEETQATGDKFRLFPDDPNSFIDEYLNPGVLIGNMASGLGSVPYDVQQGNYGRVAMNVGMPLVTGALGGIGAKNATQFANNIVNPLADIKDFVKNFVKGAKTQSHLPKKLKSYVQPQSHLPTKFKPYVQPPSDYNKLLPDDYAYKTWADEIYPNLKNNVSPEELRAAHQQSIDYFKNSPLTLDGGKEHGLFIRNVLKDKIPEFTNPVIRNFAGEQINFRFGTRKSPEIVDLLEKSGYDASKLNAQDWNIIDAYTKGYDNSINKLLRGDPASTKQWTYGSPEEGARAFYKKQSELLKEAILKNKAKDPLQLMRGTYEYNVDLLDPKTFKPSGNTKLRSELEKGDVFKDESFLSTAISTNHVPSFGSPATSEIIDIPGGSVQSIGIPEASSYPRFLDEREVILPPGLIRRVEEVEDATLPLSKGYRFRTSILNPYTVTGLLGAGAATAAQQKKNGGWLDKYEQGGLVLKQKTHDNFGKKANANNSDVSLPPEFKGLAYNTKGRNYSPAWGGQFQNGGNLMPAMAGAVQTVPMAQLGDSVKPIPMQLAMGGSIPGAVGFTYARTQGIPSNGHYAKKTKASAQNGQEMKYYQEGLDFKPKTISQDGTVIDPMGYWNPENVGSPVIIPSNVITMEGVDQPLIGISDTGDVQYMEPGEDYEFDGDYVTEYPVAKGGISVNKADEYPIEKLDQLLNFTNYNKPTKGGWLDKWAD